jgi:hypothetical protein
MNERGKLDVFAAPYAPPDEDFFKTFMSEAPNASMREASRSLARDLLREMRQTRGGIGGVRIFCTNSSFRRAKAWRS